MDNNRISAAHILRLYLWELLKREELLSEISYGTGKINPVIPIEDEPKVAGSGKSYVIYGWAENQAGDLREIRNGAFTVRVVAPTFSDVGEITTTISRAFELQDESAAHVNAWSSDFPGGAFIGIRFTFLDVTFVQSPEAPETEGGPASAVLNIQYRYITRQSAIAYVNGEWSNRLEDGSYEPIGP